MAKGTGIATNSTKIERIKHWEECNGKEKIERMRDVVKGLQTMISEQARMIQQLLNHQHLDSHVVVNIHDTQHNEIYSSRSNGSNEYF